VGVRGGEHFHGRGDGEDWFELIAARQLEGRFTMGLVEGNLCTIILSDFCIPVCSFAVRKLI
jgi:hypothetical protein